MLKLNPYIGKFTKICSAISCIFLLAIMAITGVDVIMNMIIDRSINGSYEIIQLLMLILVFFAFPYAQHKKSMLRVDFIVSKFPLRLNYIIWAFGDVLSTAVCYTLAVCAFVMGQFMSNTFASTATLLIRLHPFYYIESVALFIFALVLTYDTIISVGAIFREDFAKEIRKQWN